MAVYTKGFYSDPYCSENDAGKREKMCAKILQDAVRIGKSRRIGGSRIPDPVYQTISTQVSGAVIPAH